MRYKPKVEKREEDGVYVIFWQNDLDFIYFDEFQIQHLQKLIDNQKEKDSNARTVNRKKS